MSLSTYAPSAPAIQLAEELHQKLSAVLDELIRVILLGSQARGEATDDSDVDILIVLPNLEKSTWIRFSKLPGGLGLRPGKRFR